MRFYIILLFFIISSSLFSKWVSLLSFLKSFLIVFNFFLLFFCFLLHSGLLLTLLLPEPSIVAIGFLEKFIMGASFNNYTMLKHNDLVTVSDSWESMGNDERGWACTDFLDGSLNLLLSLVVECRSCFIKHHDWSLFEKASSNSNSLLFTSR